MDSTTESFFTERATRPGRRLVTLAEPVVSTRSAQTNGDSGSYNQDKISYQCDRCPNSYSRPDHIERHYRSREYLPVKTLLRF